jgi:hypothetical protein
MEQELAQIEEDVISNYDVLMSLWQNTDNNAQREALSHAIGKNRLALSALQRLKAAAKVPSDEEIERLAGSYADARNRRGTSVWTGEKRGVITGLRHYRDHILKASPPQEQPSIDQP